MTSEERTPYVVVPDDDAPYGGAGKVGVSSGEEREDFSISGEDLSFPP